jgi:hypothetical protein
MMMEYSIRIRIGDVEAEVSGPKEWVEKQIKIIIDICKNMEQVK